MAPPIRGAVQCIVNNNNNRDQPESATRLRMHVNVTWIKRLLRTDCLKKPWNNQEPEECRAPRGQLCTTNRQSSRI